MSTVKISELPVLASADAADEFVVVDDSAGVTKKITFDSLATDVRTESEPLTATTVTASGLVTASSGITFGSDTLDDYEEGTWTPLDGDGNTMSTVRGAHYLRIGNIAFFGADITFRSGITSNQNALFGIPFATLSESLRFGQGAGFQDGLSGVSLGSITSEDAGTSKLTFFDVTNIGATINLSGVRVIISFMFRII